MNEHLERLKAYVDNAKNHGQTTEQIRSTLLRIGWQEDLINQVLPAPPSAAVSSVAKPVNSGSGKSKFIIFFILLLLIVSGIVYWYFFTGETNNTNTTTQTPTTVAYTDAGVTFNYPVNWKKTSFSELLSGTSLTNSGDTSALFFTASKYTETKADIQTVANQSNSDLTQVLQLFSKIGTNASLILNSFKVSDQCPVVTGSITQTSCTPLSSQDYAKERAGEATKTIISTDGSSSYSSNNPVLTEKIGTTIIDSKTCYWVQNGTDSQPFIDIFIPGTVNITSINIKQVKTPQEITGELKDILNSIKVL